MRWLANGKLAILSRAYNSILQPIRLYVNLFLVDAVESCSSVSTNR